MIKVFITPREDSRATIRAEDVISYCQEKMPEHAVPRYVEFRDELPLTVTERIFKRALREEEVRKIKERETQGRQSVNAGETD